LSFTAQYKKSEAVTLKWKGTGFPLVHSFTIMPYRPFRHSAQLYVLT
jgi:hypothetical protein